MGKAHSFDHYSFIALPLTLRSESGAEIGSATGFFRQINGKQYLVSNWHVFSGRDCTRGQPLDKNARIPALVETVYPSDTVLGSWVPNQIIPLVSSSGTPLWLQHPTSGQTVDVAVVGPIEIPTGCAVYDAVSSIDVSDLLISVSENVFIVGYPLGKMFQGYFPIWKKGSIATEPSLPLDDGKSAFLVDTASRKGMSGSPVFYRSFGMAQRTGGMFGGERHYTTFVGVYSGRYGATEDLQLGIVWNEHLIEEIVAGQKAGAPEITPS